jgi:hypothetical protein
MPKITDSILLVLFGVLVGGIIGHRLRLGGDADVKRKHFRFFVESILKTITTHHPNEFSDGRPPSHLWIKADMLEKEVLDVLPFVPSASRNRLNATMTEYKNIRFCQIKEIGKNTQQHTQLCAILKRMLDCVS